ncbi:hypothetical protein ILUMI_14860 [Ignelater luminosus]|uniref:Uncharacterized protein n=1 Tax=Ignelater luminosus TaxID=2038154 RepID=A0A8K0GAI7_IGNLU|nr:hypothetical protein ILUMI_14860 [Ignelater luminosus]
MVEYRSAGDSKEKEREMESIMKNTKMPEQLNMKKEAECLIKFLNDKEGRLFTEEKEIIERLREYFSKLSERTQVKGDIQDKELSSLAFADNVAVLADSLEKLQFNMKIYEKELRKRGLKVSISKTKSMVVSKEESHHISNVEQIASANKLFHAMNRNFLGRTEATETTKLAVDKNVFVSTLCYLHPDSKTQEDSSSSRNEVPEEGGGMRPLEEMLKDRQLRKYGHLNESRYSKRARPVGTRSRVWRRTTWKDNL